MGDDELRLGVGVQRLETFADPSAQGTGASGLEFNSRDSRIQTRHPAWKAAGAIGAAVDALSEPVGRPAGVYSGPDGFRVLWNISVAGIYHFDNRGGSPPPIPVGDYESLWIEWGFASGDSDWYVSFIADSYGECARAPGPLPCPATVATFPSETYFALTPRITNVSAEIEEIDVSILGSGSGPVDGAAGKGHEQGTVDVPGRPPRLVVPTLLPPQHERSGAVASLDSGSAPGKTRTPFPAPPRGPSAPRGLLDSAVIVAAFAIILAPILFLYSRLKRKAPLSNPTRASMYEIVVATPGLNEAEISRRLGVDPSTISFHASVLLAAGLVEVRVEGRARRYFRKGSAADSGAMSNPGAADGDARLRLLALASQPRLMSLTSIAAALGVRRQSVGWHVTRLEAAGLVKKRRMGRCVVLLPTEGNGSLQPSTVGGGGASHIRYLRLA